MPKQVVLVTETDLKIGAWVKVPFRNRQPSGVREYIARIISINSVNEIVSFRAYGMTNGRDKADTWTMSRGIKKILNGTKPLYVFTESDKRVLYRMQELKLID